MTMFKVGDMVGSKVDAQSLVKGKVYKVTGVRKFITPFGDFLTYLVEDDKGTVAAVRNAHLVLEKLDPETVKDLGDDAQDSAEAKAGLEWRGGGEQN